MLKIVFTFCLIWLLFLGGFYLFKQAKNEEIISWFKFGMTATFAAFFTTVCLFLFVILF